MGRLDVTPSRFKALGARVGEIAGRGKLRSSSEAGRVLQFEAMIMGVTGKLKLWGSLEELAPRVPELDPDEIGVLIGRAEDQRARLEKLHRQAAREFGT